MFEHRHFNGGVRFRDADPSGKISNSCGGIATSAQTADGRHAGIVPALDVAVLDELDKPSFRQRRVAEVEARKFVLLGPRRYRQVRGEPVVERAVVLEFERAERMGHAFYGVRLAVGEVVGGIDAPGLAGARVLRARIDMASGNINLRDPILYRIRYADHHQTGDKWCIYPMYDFTHPISDAMENITHSLCTLEFEDHRPLYDWTLENISGPCHPRQIEFARLNLNYTITSKRKLKRLVDENFVDGWNDPRMPTISGMRRRGYTPESIRTFCDMIGVNKAGGTVDVGMLEHAIREDLNTRAPRAMCVMRPLKVTLTNYPADKTENLVLPVHPQNPEMGEREVTWSQTLYIDREDFAEEPPRKWKRLAPDQAVRLRGGYVMTCREIIRDDSGEIVELKCEYDPNTLGVNPEGYKPNGVVHWVSATDSVEVDINLYDRLFDHESPDSDKESDFTDHLNADSLVVLKGARAEKGLVEPRNDLPYQFEREGYFFCDEALSASAGHPVFNRTVTLRDSWGKGAK